ncbi:MAG: pilus assembly protein PilM, partial [Deltaproteobacteria bacterium]|nr:pilus assembly protein PilM [Deltaproteobacteria bacterium]
MSQTILGIDLGTSTVKALLIERRMQELVVLQFVQEPVNLQSRLSHEEQVVAILEKIFSNNILAADVICMSLPGHLLSSRIITLPFTNAKKISQLIDFELESHIPFPIEEIFSDYHVLGTSGNESQVLCTYTQDASLKKYIEGFSKAGIEAKYFGASITDLAGIAHVAMVPPEGFYIICDIGNSGTNLVIMEGKELKYVRAIGIGGYHFTRAIQRAFNLNQEKAESLKLSRGKLYVRAQDSDQISRILNKVALELASAIKQTIWAFGHHHKGANIMALYCCGGGSKLVGILDFLSFHLRFNVFELEVLNFVTHQFEDPDEINPIIPQVLATATRPIHSNRVPRINFRKGPYAFKQDLQMLTSELKSIGVLLLVILFLGVGYYIYADHHYANKKAAIDKQVELVIKDYK